MSTKFLTAVAFLVTGILSAQSSLIRNPKISPDATQIAFSYQGDIWTYNFNNQQTKRLTLHQAYENNPVWSTKGDALAFSSNRKGFINIFTVSKEGGVPKQITFYPTEDTPSDWTKDNEIVFTTNRIYKGREWDGQTYEVNAKGGTPNRLITAYGSMATVSPNGKFIAFVKGACRIAREDYSGSAQRDIWIYNTQTKKYIQITDTPKNDHSPLWDSAGNLYYIGAESGRYNIYKQTISSNGKVQGSSKKLTNQKTNGVASYSVSNNGTMVFSTAFNVYQQKGNSPKKLAINLVTDYRFEQEETRTTSGSVNSFDVSPNGKLIAFEVGSEIFVKENNKEKRRSNNISNDKFRDRAPQWIDDKTVIYISDRDGHNEIYSTISKDTLVGLQRSLSLETKKLTKSKEDVFDLVVSPDQKKIAYRVGRGNLMIAAIKKGEIVNPKLFSEGWASANGVSWSPDSKYIAYSQKDLDFDSEIFIQSAINPKDKINVSMHPRSDIAPVWSNDGKKLLFTSNRSGINNDVWMIWLKKEDWEKSRKDHSEGSYYAEKKAKKVKSKKKSKVKVSIDKDRIFDRLIQVTQLQDDEFGVMFSPDSKFIYFSATDPVANSRSLYKVKWDGSKPKQIKGASRIGGFLTKKENFYFTSRGRLKSLSLKSDRVTSLPHSAKYTIDYKAMNEQVFNEGTRALTAGFYDPNFHGYNWGKLIKKYKPLALRASTMQDYSFIYNLLLGQLNASHMGYNVSTPEKNNNDNIGLLGVEVKNTSKGIEVLYVLKNSVADKSKTQLKVGDVITAVNGKKINKNTNFYSLLKNTKRQEVLLTLAKGKDIVVRTSNSLRNLQYEQWIASRKALVDKYSNGQLGYIHIQGMNQPSFERFERELKASGYGKKGIVIDVRYNGGGWTTDRLMAVLNVSQHAYTVPRGAAKSLKNENKKFSKHYPFNERAILSVNTKPVVALCNENSYSNAEIFSHAFKNLGLGKLVGQPTFGAVISTSRHYLQNGTVRMPFRAWYVKKSGENMENDAPAIPDYLVKNAPGWKARGEDAQLKKAVEILLQDIR